MKILTLLLFISISLNAQIRPVNLFLNKKDTDRIDKEFEKFVKYKKIPGLSFVLANKGRIIYSNAYGFADIRKKIKLEPKHRMSVSICTQMFTSTAIHRLIQEGKLSLEDRIFGPGSIFQNEFRSVRKYEQTLTVRNLLESTVGEEWSVKESTERYLKGATFELKMNNFLREVKLRRKPNQNSYFSGICYYLLGRVIEKKTGKDYLEYVQETLKESLESDISIMGDANIKDIAVQYLDDFSISNRAGSFYNLDSANGIICSPTDVMNLFLSIDGDPVKKDVLIPAAIRILHTPSKINTKAGKGWVFDQNNKFSFNWFVRDSACVYSFEPGGLSWVVVVNGRSKKSSFTQQFMTITEEALSKIKDFP